VKAALAASPLILALAACATTMGGRTLGRDFPRAPFAAFRLDVTSVNEAEAALGPPMKLTTVRGLVAATSKRLVPGTPYALTLLSYYFFPTGSGQAGQSHPGKAASLVFLDGRLIAYGADSSLPGDANLPIDEARLDSLHQCRTTRSEAIALLGQPNGESLHVLDAQPGAIDVTYSWQNVQEGVSAHRSLRLFFDRTGAMSNYRLVDDQTAANGLPAAPHPTVPTPLPPPCPNVADRQHT
jgi:hypothetical protein